MYINTLLSNLILKAMEKKIKFLFLLLCCLINSPAIAQQMRDVSRQEALSIVKMCFNDQDVDYYLCDDPVLNVMSEGEKLSFLQSNFGNGNALSLLPWFFNIILWSYDEKILLFVCVFVLYSLFLSIRYMDKPLSLMLTWASMESWSKYWVINGINLIH